MQTSRLSFRSSAPTTDFYHGADIIAQSQAGNYSVVRVSATAINRGYSGSYDNGQGAHTAAIDGYGQAQRTGTMASGYGTGATRWDVSADITVGHDGAGNMGGVTLRQTVSGWFNNVQAVALYGFTRIPKRPGSPTNLTASQILPTSFNVNFAGPGDNGGSGLDGYLVRYWPNAEGTGQYVDASYGPTLTHTIRGLTPGTQYRVVVYARNAAADANGYSISSSPIVVRTLSGMWSIYQGVWRRTIPYVKDGGVWKAVSVFTKDAGTWKRGG